MHSTQIKSTSPQLNFKTIWTLPSGKYKAFDLNIQGPFEKFVDWQQCATVMQREAVTVMPSCSGRVNIVMACSSSL
jgi:hypothetical protein